MREMQNCNTLCNALVEKLELVEIWGKGPTSAFAALHFVSRRRDLGILDDVRSGEDQIGDRPIGCVFEGVVAPIFDEQQRRREFSNADNELVAPVEPAIGASAEGNTEGEERRHCELPVAEGAGLAHDAGNLLGALSLYAELLALPGVLYEEYREYAEDLRLLSERSSAMIPRLLERARTQSSEECEPTSVSGVVARSRGLLNRVARRRVEVVFDGESDRLVSVSAEVVERILINLVKNAAESMGDRPETIVVSVHGVDDSAEPRVMLTVADVGCGMTMAALGSLGSAAAVRKDGRGLGFRVVRELAAMSGGCVAVASAPGEGTRVSVEWPAIEQVDLAEREGKRRVLRGEAGWIAC